MPELFTFLLIFGLIVTANVIAKLDVPVYTRFFHWLLLAGNAVPFLMGTLCMAAPATLIAEIEASTGLWLPNPVAYGFTFQFMALWGALAAWQWTRTQLAQWIPLNPHSPVHTLALVLCGYLVGNVALVFAQGGLERIEELATAVSLGEVVLQQLLLALVSLLGIGYLVRRNWAAARQRLGLEPLTGRQLQISLRWIIILVALQWGVGYLWELFNPDQAARIGGITEQFVSDFTSVTDWFILAVASGVGEELFFRGALQPVFGIWFTAVLFALVHVQYGLTVITFLVFIIGLVLGYIRQRHNTTMAILVHAGYNFLLGMLALMGLAWQ